MCLVSNGAVISAIGCGSVPLFQFDYHELVPESVQKDIQVMIQLQEAGVSCRIKTWLVPFSALENNTLSKSAECLSPIAAANNTQRAANDILRNDVPSVIPPDFIVVLGVELEVRKGVRAHLVKQKGG
jgi:hypothetical protein